MKDRKPTDPSSELTELEPLESADLPELPDLEELPELPDVEELPEVEELAELPELPSDAIVPAPPKPKPAAKSAPKPKAAPKPAAKPKPKPAAATPPPAPKPPVKPVAKPVVKPVAKPVAKPEPKQEPAPVAAMVEETTEAAAAAAPATAGAAASGNALEAALAAGERPPLRELDKAPKHLRTAGMIVIAGSFLPWMGHGGGWMTSVLAKLLVLAAAWLWLKQIDHNWGPKLTGFLGKLGELELRPKKKEDEKPRRARAGSDRPTTISHPFPTGLHTLSLVVLIVGLVMPILEGLTGGSLGKAVAELGMLAWAGYTWVHIHSYERWGAFNPIFPMMFLAMLFSGLLQAATGLGADVEGLTKMSMIVGGAIVAAGGGFAAYTIVEAMVAAKKEGDAKKAAALEARRAARKTKRG
ncbi:MAG: hypothetical protein AAF682_31970 [Planctomycetota bacterium]